MDLTERMPSPEIMYVCDCCADHNPEMCGQYKREDIRFLASGSMWLCQACFEEASDDDWGIATMAPALAPLVTEREKVLRDVLETIEFQCLRWEAGSTELAAANVILSAVRLRYLPPPPEKE